MKENSTMVRMPLVNVLEVARELAETGKQVKVTGIFIDRIVDGKIVESWGEYDALGMLQQLGALPAPGR
jgi:hypothetical protein